MGSEVSAGSGYSWQPAAVPQLQAILQTQCTSGAWTVASGGGMDVQGDLSLNDKLSRYVHWPCGGGHNGASPRVAPPFGTNSDNRLIIGNGTVVELSTKVAQWR